MIKKLFKSILRLTTNVFFFFFLTKVKYGFESIPKWGHSGSRAIAEKKKKKSALDHVMIFFFFFLD